MASIDDILSFIEAGGDADDLLESAFSVDSREIYDSAIAEHGSWDGALAAALVYVVRKDAGNMDRDRSTGPAPTDVPPPERTVGPDSRLPLYLIGRSGQVLHTALDRLRASATPRLAELPEGPGAQHRPERMTMGIDDPGLVIVTNTGNGVAIDSRLLPAWERDALTRPLNHRFGDMSDDEVGAAVLPRRLLRDADRFYSVSVFGQIKATDASEYKRLSADATTAVLLRDDDALFDVFAGAARADVFVASSLAKAIVFSTSDIRSQGRKATGVRAIALDPDARVVGAFDTAGQEWVVLATDRGLMKRMPLTEFRPQGRGGGGLQTCRLNPGDHVASMAPAPIDGDVVVLTSTGRFARFPTYSLPFGGRAAKGEPVLELGADELVIQVLGVPAGHVAD